MMVVQLIQFDGSRKGHLTDLGPSEASVVV
jgi:hypothetical protein